MKKFRVACFVLAFPLFALSLGACAGSCLPQVDDGWIRLGPAGMPMMAGFGKITNSCGVPATVVAAGSSAFGEVSIHETRIENGISRMRPLAQVPVAANDAVLFQPGGKHLMLMQPETALQPGDTVKIVFELEDGRVVPGTFEVRAPGA